MNDRELTDKLDDYLEAIFVLSKSKNQPVRIKEIASWLKLNKTTVVATMKKLKERNMIKQEHYGAIFLTEEGKKRAETLYSKHLVIKNFLVQVLGIEEWIADKEACGIEHLLSDHTIQKMEELRIRSLLK